MARSNGIMKRKENMGARAAGSLAVVATLMWQGVG